MAEYVTSVAKGRGLVVHHDDVGNIVVPVPATPHHEDAPVTVLQSHLDMVCVKRFDIQHDFENDSIPVAVESDWVAAKGTTLGADDGIGVAAALAVLDDRTIVHGGLELLFTVGEETGFTGAKALDPTLIIGRRMLNLDSGRENTICIGCAGGASSTVVVPLERIPTSLATMPLRIQVCGLRGGHSGVDIHENRANAIKLLARTLSAALTFGVTVELVSLVGGSEHNVIPSEALAILHLPRNEAAKLRKVVERMKSAFIEEYGPVDPGLNIQLEEIHDVKGLGQIMTADTRDRVLAILNGTPHGVMTISRDVPGLVETSNNLAIVHTEDERVVIVVSHRSSVMPALRAAQDQVRSVCWLGNAEVIEHSSYPSWKPNPNSPFLHTVIAVFERLFGQKPKVTTIHAGLECALIGEKLPDMEIVSLGPRIEGAHSPGERVQISSVQKFWTYLRAVLKKLS